jgi:hypothetical protein
MFSILPATEFYVGQYTVPRDRLVILHRSPQPGISDTQGGLINLARIKFAEAIAADGYSSRYWQAGGPTDRALVAEGILPTAIAEQNSERWAERRAKGPDHVPVLVGGMRLEQYGVDPTQQAAVEARRELVADVGRYFGVPTRILNAPTGDTETYATSESGNQDLVRYTLQNYIGAIEDAISDQLPGGRYMHMDTRRLTAGTQLAQAQALQLLTGNKAVMLPEEGREWLGLPPMEDPDALNPPAPTPVVAPAERSAQGEDDHYYGKWIGGSVSEGGHPAGSAGDPKESGTPDFEMHEHYNLKTGQTVTHSHANTVTPHLDHGPATLTISSVEWTHQTGLKGGGTKKYTKGPTGPQLGGH